MNRTADVSAARAGTSARAIRFAITGAIVAGLLAGCAGSTHMARAGNHAVRSSGQQARAVDGAETLVAKSPNDAAARIALGQAYLDAGRFQSAATTFSDAVTLGDSSSRAQLSLALAKIGAGDSHGAIVVLDEARDTISPTDRGLALALAGESNRGVAILLDALRAGENSPKLRQNLAFAYAINGSWREARITMGQDVPPDQIDDRIGEWAMMSRPEDVQRRVASLLGVPMGIQDAGQPATLALGQPSQGERFAAAETPTTLDAAPVAQTAAAELPAAGELPALDATPAAVYAVADPAPAPVPAQYADPAAFSASAPVAAAAQSVPALVSAPAPAPAASSFASAFAAAKPTSHRAFQRDSQPVARPAAMRVARLSAPQPTAAMQAAAFGTGSHMVQLGSFSSEANARRAWQIYIARNPELRDMQMTITPAIVRGKNFWRVAAAGLDVGGASRLCSGVKNRGGACFAYASNHMPAGAQATFAFAGLGKSRSR